MGPQDPVSQQAKAAEVGEARSLSQPGCLRHVQGWAHPRDRQIEVDPALELSTAKRAAQPLARFLAEQPAEPVGVEADGDDDKVVGDALSLAAVLDRDDGLALARLDRHRAARECPVATRLVENRFGLLGKDAAVSTLDELAPVRLGQPRPVARIGEVAALVITLPAREQDTASGQDVNRRPLVRLGQQADDYRRRGLAAADDAEALRDVGPERSLRQPVAPPVENPRMLGRLAGDADRRPRASDDDAVSLDRLAGP